MGSNHGSALKRAYISLAGLSVGDAFGEQFFVDEYYATQMIETRSLPAAPWRFTDDTNMALSIVACLRKFGHIDQDWLANNFAERFDYHRSYGVGMFNLLEEIRAGKPWRREVRRLFHGEGSYGNGAAMRVAPLGAYFAHDLKLVVEQARLSAEVTHAHPEGIAGAIAIAVASALVCQSASNPLLPRYQEFLQNVITYVPESEVKSGIVQALGLSEATTVIEAARVLGNGSKVTARDTVPFVLWCASRFLNSYEEALWSTVRGFGDRDTTCAMVGGIVAGYTGLAGIPNEWREARESLPDWALEKD